MTENEYRTAEALGIAVLPFIRRVGRRGARYIGRQKAFRDEVAIRHYAARGFLPFDELPEMILEALDGWSARHPGCGKPHAARVDDVNAQLADLLAVGPRDDPRYFADLDRTVLRLSTTPRRVDPQLRAELIGLLDLLGDASDRGDEARAIRMELRTQEERWPEAFGEPEQLVRSGRVARDPAMALRAGTLLMTLGSYDDADALLAMAVHRSADPTVQALARSIRLWIRDYRGAHGAVVRASDAFLPAAADMGAALAAGVQHRKGRALLGVASMQSRAAARSTRQCALRELERAWVLQRDAGDTETPYPAQWIYRAKHALGIRDRGKSLALAEEMAKSAGRAPSTHIEMLRGDELADLAPIQARPHYEEALRVWKELGYRKGVHDLALRLATVIYRVDGPSHEGLRLAVLAERIASSMRLPTRRDAALLTGRLAGGAVSRDRAHDVEGELVAMSYDLVLHGLELPRDLFWVPGPPGGSETS